LADRRETIRAGAALLATAAFPRPAWAQAPTADANEQLLASLVNVFDFEPVAHERLSKMAWEYISGAAGDETTLRWNREAYDKIRLKPRILMDVSKLDTRVSVFGQELPFPILLAPTAYHRLFHPEGELAAARGAGALGAGMVLSSFSNTSVEDVAKAAKAPLWFQLYVQRDRELTRDMVQRAEAAGCRAICVTVDTPVRGARNREERIGFALPPELGLPNLRMRSGSAATARGHASSESEIFSAILDPTLTWKEIAWLRGVARVPVLLKGVLNPDDAVRAADEGVAGLIVSNHGARNLDTVPATIDALPRIADKVGSRVTLLMDGGIRRGTDVLKALALGARAVLIGRPYVYGLSAAGEHGVAAVLKILKRELEMAMALSGRRSLAEVDSSVLW
jgi:4-hydroxymandelate oxidase